MPRRDRLSGSGRRRFLGLSLGAAAATTMPRLARPARGASGRTVEVVLRDHRFVPEVIEAEPGDVIEFRNQDKDLHSVILIDRQDVLEETFIDPGAALRVDLPTELPAGRYRLACTIHVDMRAEIVVG